MAAMDWTYPANSGDAGIFEIGRRLAEALGRAPDATSFTYDPRAMLRTTREIERAARGGHLLVGFQKADKLVVEADRYVDLLAGGTDLTVWAIGPRPADPRLSELDYREARRDTNRLDAQWFLVSDRPEPLAFVSYELGDPASFGVGGAATPGKRFVGFVSDDPAVVALLIDALRPLGAPQPPLPPRPLSEAAQTIAAAIDSAGTAPSLPADAGDGAIIVPIGRGLDRDAVVTAIGIARRDGRSLVFVDRSAEGFTSPYSDLRGDDAGRPSPERLFDAETARLEGRNALADFLDAARSSGVEAGAWYPTKAGADGLADAVRRFVGAIVVLPSDAAKPRLAERLRGMTLDSLRSTVGIPVVVANQA
ncbi:MAG: hypothetical protein ABIZ72_05240 [Candidatus Limnocylindrales bacterium]